MLPPDDRLIICFAHVAYRLDERFRTLATGIRSFAVRDDATLFERVGEADVLVISGLWRNEILDRAPRLAFIQSIGAGTDQFPLPALRERGIRLASARGVNAAAVAEHAMALILALARRLGEARDNQRKRHWRQMIGEIERREDELSGKTLLVVGLGEIGGRIVRLAKAFDMRVVAVRRDPAKGGGGADAVHALMAFRSLLSEADFIVLACPLTAETENLLDAAAFARMKPGAHLVNVARGRVVDEAALIAALAAGRIAGAGLDVTEDEPLAPDSPLWNIDEVLLTPHTAGETRRYEDNVIAILRANLAHLRRGEPLVNEVV